MDSGSQWTRVRQAFAEVEEAPADERSALIAKLDPAIREEVESLLAAASSSPGVLALGEDASPLHIGDTIGPYRLEAELGRGGMGIVYRAARGDGEFRREVAIKVAAGRMFPPEAERRFIQERQILAQLDHPHIVRMLDGGLSRGQRYFVMELADGVPITAYSRSHALGLSDRLRLFRDLCAAIHYAHQRLILHRDLKPGNIVVTADGSAKVLDFGIAQLLQSADDDGTGSRGVETTLRPFSLACASPEQLRGERLSLASDIYSLGVLLYELIAGVNPQWNENDSFDDVYRRVVDGSPAKPSRVAKRLPRDLDAIVLKALAKQPSDRYGSVAELDADIERFLNGRPVIAVPPRAAYVAARFIQRNKALTATAAALLVLLIAGAAVYVRQARLERRRFEDASRLVHSVVFDIQPKLEGVAAALPLRKTLIEETMRYLESVSRDAGNDVGLLHELSNAYRELARVQGDLTTSSLGAQAPAVERFARADALMQRALTSAPNDPGLLKDAALLYSRLASFESTQGHADIAFTRAKRAVEYAEQNVQARPPGEFDAREILAGTTFYLGVAAPQADWDFRIATFKRTQELFSQLATEQPAKEALSRNIASASRFLSTLYADKQRYGDAIAESRRALSTNDAILARRPDDATIQVEASVDAGLLASYLDSNGQVDDAAAVFDRAIALSERALATDAANARARLFLADGARGYAANRLTAGDPAAARRHITRALDTFSSMQSLGQLPPGVRWRVASATRVLAEIELADRHAAAACEAYRAAARLFDEFGKQSPIVDALKIEADGVRAKASECGAR